MISMFLSKKGITPIVATILLLLLTVAVGGFTYVWMTRLQKGITGGITERLTSVLTGMKAEATIESIWDENDTDSNLTLSIRNTGDTDIVIDTDTGSGYCNGKPMAIKNNISLSPGQQDEVVVNCTEPTVNGGSCCCNNLTKDSVEIKITTPNIEIIGNLYDRSTVGSPYCTKV